MAERPAKICEKGGGGYVFPVFDDEHSWSEGVRCVLYLAGLLYFFLGVSIIADLFMEAIEVITSKTRVVKMGRHNVEVKVWNATIANLTLMALGSSAPEILLNVIETIGGDFFSGSLGPSTIVGSAAFNLLVILAVCCTALPAGEGRRIAELDVFFVTALSSLFAYIWLLIILQYSSPDIVTVLEGTLTFAFFPVLVCSAYAADMGLFRRKNPSAIVPDDGKMTAAHVKSITGEGLATVERKIIAKQLKESGVSGNAENLDEIVKLLALQQMRPSRAACRINAIRSMTGGKRVVPSAKMREQARERAAVLERATEEKQGTAVVQFSSEVFMVSEGDGKVDVIVKRAPAAGACTVAYEDTEGTATAGVDYEPVSGILEFADGESEKIVTIPINDDDEVEEDEFFTLTLSDPKSCELGNWSTTTIIIVDDDDPGDVGFDDSQQNVSVVESAGFVELTVRRFNGSTGTVSCEFSTKELRGKNAATAGEDFVATKGTITFAPQQMQATIKIELLDDDKFERDEVFKVILANPKGPLPDRTAIHENENGEKMCECKVTIISDDDADNIADSFLKAMSDTAAKYKLGTSGYAQQFSDALFIHGGDIDPDEPPTCVDYAMHCVALPFKLAFALVPPSEYYGGWACFWVALFFIAVVTVCIQDLAMLFGCALGLKDEVTAITIVALGTSLPDTFASKTAAVSDDTADAAIGNITGSNSVNVFLGLGLPWMIAAIKWELYGPNKAWRERYGESGVEGWDSTAPKLGEDKFGFAVPAGSLGFSVTIFTVCSVICFVILYLRRITVGFELGGPPDSAKWTALLFVGMWFFYILMSSLEAYGHL